MFSADISGFRVTGSLQRLLSFDLWEPAACPSVSPTLRLMRFGALWIQVYTASPGSFFRSDRLWSLIAEHCVEFAGSWWPFAAGCVSWSVLGSWGDRSPSRSTLRRCRRSVAATPRNIHCRTRVGFTEKNFNTAYFYVSIPVTLMNRRLG